MAEVDSAYAAWLKSDALYRNWANAGLPAPLAPMAIESEIISPFAVTASVDTELTRQGAFLGFALAADQASIPGRRSDLLGKCITLKGDLLKYDGAGATVLVISAQEQDDGTTDIQVLRKL